MVASGAVDAHGHDHRAGFLRDQPGAVIDLHQAAGDGETPFRKDHQRIARLHGVDQRARADRLRRIERNGAREMQEGLHPPVSARCRIDGEDRLLRHDREDRRGVEEAHMIERDDGIRSRPCRNSPAPSPRAGRRRERRSTADPEKAGRRPPCVSRSRRASATRAHAEEERRRT